MAYANVSRPNGAIPFERSAGASEVRPRPVPAVRTASTGGNASTDLALGDLYAIDANGNVYRAGPGDVVRGVINGFEIQANPGNPPGSAVNSIGNLITGNGGQTGTTQIASALGIEDNACSFEMQADSYPAGTPPYGVYNLIDAAPDNVYGISQQRVGILAGPVGSQIKVIGLKTSTGDNSFGVNARVIVQLVQPTNA